ncbi:myosin light chain kinase, smooth muscle isoform X1 [Brienomyrus brachyistius]|uniref:myosin light chain kinase, smooth muscle isoform X1 n=2 Tax=Brienomyrus brachyistius TaxID=42636 RepID=UPI0020B22529|nr:myosin light chain kinase, smooth muscle isoform X1 [Brienomyrus brachyistius]
MSSMGDGRLLTTTVTSKFSLNLSRGSRVMETPTFIVPPRNVRVRLGGTVRLNGKVKGHPDPQVIWYRGGRPVIAGGRYAMEQNAQGDFGLSIEGVRADDADRYTCEALSDAGCLQVTVEIIVEGTTQNKYNLPSSSGMSGARFGIPAEEKKHSIWGESPPKFVTKPSRVFSTVGKSCKFSAKTTGRPQPQVRWFKGKLDLCGDSRFSAFHKSGVHFLEFHDVRPEDAGEYTCVVVNSAGKASATAELTVKGTCTETNSNSSPGAVTVGPKMVDSPVVKHVLNGVGVDERTKISERQEKMERLKAAVREGRLELKPEGGDTGASSQKLQCNSRVTSSRGPSLQCRSTNSIMLRAVSVLRDGGVAEAGGPQQPVQTTSSDTPGQARGTENESWLPLVETPPHFDMEPQNQDVLEGQKVVFICKVSGSPTPILSWIKDGLTVRVGGDLKIHQEGRVYLLSLTRVRKKDCGIYGCTASNILGKASVSWTLSIKGLGADGKAPKFSNALRDCSVDEGKGLSLQCTLEGKPSPLISWLLNDQPIPDANCSFDGSVAWLMVQDTLPKDGGVYTCIAENEHGQATCSARVCVHERKVALVREAADAGQTPVFLKSLKDLEVMDGSQVTMTVEVTGDPEPHVMWLHDDQEIQESEDFHFEKKGNLYSLLIQEVFPEDTGRYTCEAWNEAGEAHSQATLTVQEPQDGTQPWFITKPKPVTASLGQHALLSCAITGDPFPRFQWRKGGQPLSSGVDYEVLEKEDVVSLLIRRVKAHHAGDYEINLKNKVGECSCVAALQVRPGMAVSSAEPRYGEARQTVGVAEGTASSRGTVNDEGKPEEAASIRGPLKRDAKTREQREDQPRHQEAEQQDFRTVLGRRTGAKGRLEEDRTGPMDFRANLRTAKSKEDERKVSAPQQVDFRAVLAKKGGYASRPGASTLNRLEPPQNASTDFRSVLGNKKKQMGVENNVAVAALKPALRKTERQIDVNCVDGRIIDKKDNVTGKAPIFTQKLKDVTVVEGECLRLQCQVTADPLPTITWTLDKKVVKPSKFILLSHEGGQCSLTIDKALLEDEGQYKCRAENCAGTAECCCKVLVDDPSNTGPTQAGKRTKKISPTTENEARIKKKLAPKAPPTHAIPPQITQFPEDMKILAGEKVDLLCTFGGTQPITCSWLKFRKPIKPGQDGISIESTETTTQLTISPATQDHCGCYTAEIQNKFGTRQASLNLTIVDKPDPPARVPATSDIRKSSLTLSWYGPTYDGGSAVLSYHLEVWDSVDKEWKHLVSCNSTSYCIQELLSEREYKFRVRAENVYGIGDPSAESEPVKVGVEVEDNAEDEADLSDDEKEPEYRAVAIKADQKVKDFYDVEERLGTGKFGQVFKLVEKATKKAWAGKFIKAYSAKERENVRQEIDIMNSLHHPKLVQCVDAFETKSDIVMVLELISGGELFDRIIDEDFELTEREVIKYMLQIIDGVQFIHNQGIVHLDLKPENIMCVNRTGSRIKLIDFGLARRLENAGSLKVLFGTPEFVAPEVINYEPISYPTDMWSIGVICYILVSGLSPFMGDNDNETLSNVTSATWDFEDEAFDEISDEAKDFISNLLKKNLKARLTCAQCLEHPWLKQDTKNMEAKKLSKERMKKYILRRKWQKTGHAVRAIGRLASMAMLAGISAKKSNASIEEDLLQTLDEENRPHVKPSFSIKIKDVEVVEGSAARFDCKIEGYPDPEVVWFKDDQPIKETRHFQIDYDEDGNCSLVISDVSGEDDAKYTCKAMNSVGEATCMAELLVEVMATEEEEEEEE